MGDIGNDEGALSTPDWNSLGESLIDVAAKLIIFVASAWVVSIALNYLTLIDIRIEWIDAIIIGFLLRWVAIRLRIGA